MSNILPRFADAANTDIFTISDPDVLADDNPEDTSTVFTIETNRDADGCTDDCYVERLSRAFPGFDVSELPVSPLDEAKGVSLGIALNNRPFECN